MHRTDAVRPCTRAHVCAHRHTEPDTSARGMHIQDRGTDFSFMTVQSLHTDTDRSGSPRHGNAIGISPAFRHTLHFRLGLLRTHGEQGA